MLTSTRFSDEAGLAHALGKECLTKHVVDLVRTGVVEIFAFEQHTHAEFC
jgi:hypothetical protein